MEQFMGGTGINWFHIIVVAGFLGWIASKKLLYNTCFSTNESYVVLGVAAVVVFYHVYRLMTKSQLLGLQQHPTTGLQMHYVKGTPPKVKSTNPETGSEIHYVHKA